MSHEEQHERLCQILSGLAEVLNGDDLSLLAHSCGVSVADFYGDPVQEDDLFKEAA